MKKGTTFSEKTKKLISKKCRKAWQENREKYMDYLSSKENKVRVSKMMSGPKEVLTRAFQGKPSNVNKKWSKYVGVTWGDGYAMGSGWQANITFKRTKYYLGHYLTPEEAAFAYNKKALELYGQTAKLNIIPE